jgi:Glycine/serine hydroxymethyltransferase
VKLLWGSKHNYKQNAVPNDPQSPFVTSGIRLGTPAITTRGFGITEVEILSNWICDIVLDHQMKIN